MTRENKIGLLVGLGFIIAVGILFSNYLSTDNEPTPAPLQLAGSAVRSSLGDPADPGEAGIPTVHVPPAVAPVGPVPTSAELAARARRPAPQATVAVAPVVTETDPTPLTALAAVPTNPASIPPASNSDLIDAARRAGQELVAPTNGGADPTPAPVTPKHATAQTIKAEPGESLGDLAERAYGTSTKATREALLAANPGLRANPNLIVAGRSYVVAPAAPATATPAPRTAAATAKASTADVATYTVQPGDTLWSIARDEVGTPRAVDAILDLNRDVLPRGDHLRVNMKLRLPKRKGSSES